MSNLSDSTKSGIGFGSALAVVAHGLKWSGGNNEN